jgi:hypothetical protein
MKKRLKSTLVNMLNLLLEIWNHDDPIEKKVKKNNKFQSPTNLILRDEIKTKFI